MNRELDVKIARAKGFELCGEMWCHPSYEDCNYWFIDSKKESDSVLQPVYREGNPWFEVVPFWSDDLLTAWELVDEMIDEFWEPTMKRCNNRWYVEFGDMTSAVNGAGDTVQEAICKAYLEWKEMVGENEMA